MHSRDSVVRGELLHLTSYPDQVATQSFDARRSTSAVTVRPSAAWHEPSPSARSDAGILLANVVAEVGIVVTGGLVRLTGSGLGLPDLAGVHRRQPGPGGDASRRGSTSSSSSATGC